MKCRRAGRSVGLPGYLGFSILLLSFNAAIDYGATPEPEQANPWTFSLYFGKDLFFNKDEHYTNGSKLAWISPDLTSYAASKERLDWSHRYIHMPPFINEPGLKCNV